MDRSALKHSYRSVSQAVSSWLQYQDYQLVSWLFVRTLGVIYLIAFASLLVQVQGLAGTTGILPAGDLLAQVASQTGWDRYIGLPTVFWLNSSNIALLAAAAAVV